MLAPVIPSSLTDAYWIIGRVMPLETPFSDSLTKVMPPPIPQASSREVYLCVRDGTPTTVVELAFRELFGQPV